MKTTKRKPIITKTVFLMTLLIIAVLLSACSDLFISNDTVKSHSKLQLPIEAGGFGLVKVTIKGIGTEHMRASAAPAVPLVAANLTAPFDNTGLKLDGAGDYMTANGVSDDAAVLSDFTVEAWVFPESTSGTQQTIFGFHTNTGENRNIVFYNPDTDQFSYYDDAIGYFQAVGTYSSGHIAFTITLASPSSFARLYINGQLKATFPTSVRPEAGGFFSVGQEWDDASASDFFSGQIDELRVWDTALTQTEIQNTMNQQIPPTTAGLVSYYRFNKGSGTAATDLAGDNDGIFAGDATFGNGRQLGDDGTIALEPFSNGSFTDGTRGSGGVRYIYATFKVRNADASGNAYGNARHNLTFMAVDTDNMAAAGETFGITTISSLRLFNGTLLTGTDAVTIAGQTLPTGGAAFRNIDGTIATQFPDVLQVFSEATVGAITTPTGVEVLPYGFITRSPAVTPGSRTLPAGPMPGQFDGIVTFAFKVPLQTQANQDPFEITALFLPVDDSRTRLTQSLEEQTIKGNAALAGKVNALNPDVITLLPGSTYAGPGKTQFRCEPVRVSGPESTPAATLFPDPRVINSLTPNPYAGNGSASHIAASTTFMAVFSETISGINPSTYVVRSFQSGKWFVGQSYSGNGTETITTPTAGFFPGEVVEVSLVTGLGLCPPNRVVRYRVEATGNGSFGNVSDKTNYAMGDWPSSVVLGDFDEDGDLDMVTANTNSDDLSVRLGNGDGTFAAASTYGAGNNPRFVAVGDLNADGRLDLVTANYTDNNVGVRLGFGNGTFDNASHYSLGSGPFSVALGDLNGDGSLDIVTANQISEDVSVYTGNGDGTFSADRTYSVGSDPYSIALGDLNGDGTLDFVTANKQSSTVSVRLGDGYGAFGVENTYSVGTSPYSIALGYLNADSYLDIVTANAFDNNTSVLLGNGNGTFNTASNYLMGFGSIGPSAVALGDLNGDNYLDIVTANQLTNEVSVRFNDGNGLFGSGSSTNYAMGDNPRSVALGDLDGDGSLDIVITNANDDNVSVRFNQ